MKVIFQLSFLLFILSSCQDTTSKTPIPRTEKIEVYSVKNVEGEFVKSKIKFAEAYVYGDDGRKVDHFILDEDGGIINKEKMIYDERDVLTRSEYYNMFDSLLSYYTYAYEGKDTEVKKSYDASNNELLRIEKVYKDNNGWDTKKELYSADNQLQRVYSFQYDEYGNETYFSILNALGERIRSEQFKISKMDENNQWLERWGFENDKPISCRSRKFGYGKKPE